MAGCGHSISWPATAHAASAADARPLSGVRPNGVRESSVHDDASRVWPASVRVGEKTIFLIEIDTSPNRPSASKRRKMSHVTITAADLTKGL